jgi:hypothetical protein
MRVRDIIFGTITAVCIVAPAHAQFGGFSKPSTPAVPSGGGGATPAEVDKFVSDASTADALVQNSAMQLLRAVTAKEKVDEVDQRLKAAQAISDPQERRAKISEVQKDAQTELKKADFAKAAETLKTSVDEKKKQSARAGIFNLALGSLKNVELAATGKKLVSGTPSPTVAPKIPDVKFAVDKLTSQAEGWTSVVASAKTLMSAVGLQALPTSAAEKPIPAPAD